MKKKLALLLICLFSIFYSFAGGTSEARLFYMPRNIVNNQNVMIELSQAKQLSIDDIHSDFQNSEKDNLSIFRIRSSLYLKDQVSDGLIIRISSNDNWLFINEDNPTEKRPFELKAIVSCREKDNGNYSNVSKYEVNNRTNLPQNVYTSFSKVGSVYELRIPFTDFSKEDWYYLTWNPNCIWEFDICISILDNDTNLQHGYYQTSLNINSEPYQEHKAEESLSKKVSKIGSKITFNETINIRGQVGLDEQSASDSYSFSVLSRSDTYNMNLGINTQTEPYHVANIHFYNIALKNYKPNEEIEKNRFKLYVSPTSNYLVDGTYQFIRMNSENQARTDENTIYYNLCLNTASGYKEMRNLSSNETYSSDNKIGSAGVEVNKPSTTYCLIPKYEIYQISSPGFLSGIEQHRQLWELDADIYLKIDLQSLNKTHEKGLYYTYMYVTLVAN